MRKLTAALLLVLCRLVLSAEQPIGSSVQIAGLPAEAAIPANRPGFCLNLGSGDGNLAVEILQKTKYTVFCLAKDDKDCETARQTLDKLNLYGSRATAMTGSLKSLPFPKGYGNLIVTGEYQDTLSLKEVMRVLNPNGIAVIGGGMTDAGKLKAALEAAGIQNFTLSGNFAVFRGRMPEGADDWTHMRHGPDNNRVSSDASIRPPFQTQWISGGGGGPVFVQNMLAAQGRLLLLRTTDSGNITMWDAFNGTPLWVYPKNGGSMPCLMTGTAMAGERVYAATGDKALALDAATGDVVQTYEVRDDQDIRGKWPWLAVHDGMLLVQAEGADGKAVYMHPTGAVYFALDLQTGKLLWKHKCKSPALTDTTCVGDGALYYRDGLAGAVAVDLKTGQQRWANAELAGNGVANGKDNDPNKAFHDWSGQSIGLGAVYGADAVHFISGWSSVMVDSKDGRKLWEKIRTKNPTDLCMYPAIVNGKVYSFMTGGGKGWLRTFNPKTGAELEIKTGEAGGCGPGVFSASTAFTSGQRFSTMEMETGKVHKMSGFRTPCGNGPLPSQGLLYTMPMRCGCLYPVMVPLALAPAEAMPDGRNELEARLKKGPVFDASLPAGEEAAEWPCWRGGPGHTGQVNTAPKVPLKLGWQQKLSAALTPPSVGGGMLYVGSQQGAVWALDPVNGQVRWKFLCGGEVPVTPTYTLGRVLIGSGDGWVYCLEAKSGKLAWQFRAAPRELYINRQGNLVSLWPVDSGVVVDNGMAYFAGGALTHDGVYVYAVDVATGKMAWMTQSDGYSLGPIALAGELLIVPGGGGKNQTRAFKKSDGAPVPWFSNAPGMAKVNMGYSSVWGAEIVADSTGYLTGGLARYRRGAIDPFLLCETETGFAEGWVASARKTPFAKTPYAYPLAGLAAPILTEKAVVLDGVACERRKIGALNTCGRYYAADSRAELESGALWSVQPWPAGGKEKTCSQALAGEVFLAARASEVTAFEAKPSGKELGRVTVPGKIVRNSLTVSGGAVFVVTQDGAVYRLNDE